MKKAWAHKLEARWAISRRRLWCAYHPRRAVPCSEAGVNKQAAQAAMVASIVEVVSVPIQRRRAGRGRVELKAHCSMYTRVCARQAVVTHSVKTAKSVELSSTSIMEQTPYEGEGYFCVSACG